MTNQTLQKWNKVKLSKLGSVDRGRSRHRPRNDASLYGGAYPFVQTGDVKSANFYITSYSQTYNEKGLAQSKIWDPCTLCITIAANIGESAILKIPACFPDSIVGFRSYEGISDVRFVKYFLDFLKNQFQAISKGTTQDNLSLDKLLSIDLNVPNYLTQTHIADFLIAYDNLIENNSRRIKILEQMAQAIYTEWFVNFRFPDHEKIKMVDSVSDFGKIPEGWGILQVDNIVQRVSPSKLYDNKTVSPSGKVPVLDQGKSGIIGYHNDEPGVVASVEKPVIVFANHTCYQRLMLFPFSAIQNVLPFYPSEEKYRNIFWLHFATKDLIKFNDYKGHWPEFMQKKLVVPTAEMSDKFAEMIKPFVILSYQLELANKNVRQTRDLLLSKLVTGEIKI